VTAAVVDAALVRAAAGGDTSAFARVVDAYRATVSSIALAIVRDVPMSEDVAQEVFVAAWQRLADLRDASSLGPWLRQVTRNRAHDALRRRREAPLDPAAASTRADDTLEPDAVVVAREEHAVVVEALDELPTEAREILLLYYREGQSIRQVAHLLDLSEAAAKKRLSRARGRLRQDVRARFSDAAARTGPRAAFTAGVVAAITTASPSTAAAASTAVAAGAKVSKLALGGAIAGPLLGVAGAVAGLRRVKRRARSEAERTALTRLTVVAVAHILILAVGMGPLLRWAEHPAAIWIWYVALIGGFAVIYFVWLPRIIADRLAAERREDPDAARRQRRERWLGFAGWLVGALSAAAAIAWAAAHPS
jgi:RNA polymerase sigma factor (sigma-70 family)